jgi:LmbE family N-acetylglucosaminyl deacetylase
MLMAGITKTTRRLLIRTILKGISSAISIPKKRTVVIAPHPDDETLGCGGTIALMRAAGVPVSVVFFSRGEASHADCCKTPMEQVGQARERSAVHALSLLGIEEKDIHWLGIADRGFVRKGQDGFIETVKRLRELIFRLSPDVVISPYYLDVLPDHEACAEMVYEAMDDLKSCEQMFYPVWMWHRLRMKKLPVVLRDKVLRMDISGVLDKKIAAMEVYFKDANPECGHPWCGRLPEEFHRYFAYPYEIFMKAR